ncbi:MAG: hypothetical protein AUK03_05580 [Anaerolineae bacterium CG2_30_64_16]|nr:MAG: hypothetical protein AUK03_05580 [Anaerolineae bacterium CG2_30_64_16]
MTEETVKLTVRLPATLHQVLKERAVEYDVSLNQVLVDTLSAKLVSSVEEETEVEKFDRMLHQEGWLAKTDWLDQFIEGVEPASLDEMREVLRGVPLSDWIIEDRGPR